MTSIRESIRRRFVPHQPLPQGIYHYQAPPDDPNNYRLHLRVEPGGTGILIVNASTILHLNQTAVEYAYHLIHRTPLEQVSLQISERYHTTSEQAKADYIDFVDRIETLATVHDLDPVTFLEFDRQTPNETHISAPYRLDCALTYRLPADSDATAAPVSLVTRELTTSEWSSIFDDAWQAGIPHIVFTGGEPTLREDLPDLIARAESNGQVTGLVTDGIRFFDRNYMETLLRTGLDHIMIILDPANERVWKALEYVIPEDIFVAVHLTLTPSNRDEIPLLLERLAGMDLKAISLTTSDPGLNETLQSCRAIAAGLGFTLVWNLPVPYSALNPVALEVYSQEHATGAGKAWLYIEPDGDVLPVQGSDQVLGNFLKDSWDQIWKATNQDLAA
jgi:hypothetical protein